MRNDLTAPFLAAMASDSRAPIQLAEIHFPDRIVYVSDQDRSLWGKEYIGVVEDWGEITTAGTETNDIISETLQVSVSFWNGGDRPFSYDFLEADPTDIPVFLYQTFDGLGEGDVALVGEFVIQDPIEMAEASRLFRLDLVSVNMRYTANVGPVLNRTDWPNALEADVNKGIDLIIGDAGAVQTLCARTPLSCTLKGSILKLPTIVNTHENLDELGYLAAGRIVIDDEILYYASRDEDTFNVTIRGDLGTIATEHSDGATILEYISDHTYLIGQGPITSISDVRVGGLPADQGDYSIDLVSDPARIVFPVQPSYVSYSRGARTTEADFDSTAGDNTAYQPHYAYDTEYKSYGALISQAYRKLSVNQVDQAVDEGEVVRVFLSVEHWATAVIPNDRIDVAVEGLGVVGQLSKPNAADVTTVDGEVDIDHGHDHEIGGIHDHGFVNPGLDTSNPSHDHTTAGTYDDTYYAPVPIEATWSGNSPYYYPTNAGYASQNTILYSIDWYSYDPPYSVDVRYRKNGTWYGFSVSSSPTTVPKAVSVGSGTVDAIYFRHTPVSGGTTTFLSMSITLERVKSLTINDRTTAVNASHTSTGNVGDRGIDTSGLAIKDQEDVDDLSTANRLLENISTTSSSKKVVDKFDLTAALESIDWSWLQDRNVSVSYVGSANAAEILVTYIWFEVEYRQRENVITNDVTCRPVGSLENRPDAVIEYLLHNVAGVPLESMGSIFIDVDIWEDNDQWIDTNIWRDTGERIPVPGDPAFLDAAERYAFLGYRLDGVISADCTVQDCVKSICRQARGRLIWSAGLVKLAVREKTDDWITAKVVDQLQTQLRSLRFEKSKVTEIENDINLSYQVDRLSEADGEGQYDASILETDLDSIALHGQKKYNDNWLFDLVRDDAMAADLADYYIWRYGEPISRFYLRSYLMNFDLEKEDVFRITSNFGKINQLPVRIVENSRAFGSGKLGQINTIDFTGESIRHKFLYLFLEDTVLALDDISVGIDDEESIEDSVAVEEILQASFTTYPEDQSAVSDELVLSMGFRNTPAEEVIAIDGVASSLTIVLSDSAGVSDNIAVSYEPCFGACGFGGVEPDCLLPFGAVTRFYSDPSSEAGASDEISVTTEYNLELADEISILDELKIYDTLGDNVGADEELIFNTCFGCTIENATGFGLNNFGR